MCELTVDKSSRPLRYIVRALEADHGQKKNPIYIDWEELSIWIKNQQISHEHSSRHKNAHRHHPKDLQSRPL